MESRYYLNMDLALMEEYKINGDQLMFLKCLMLFQTGDEDLGPEYINEDKKEFLNKYYNLENRTDLREAINYFKTVGIISKDYSIPERGQKLVISKIKFNKNFIKKYFMSSQDLGQELIDHYPTNIYVNGGEFCSINYAKKFDSFEDFSYFYAKQIKYNPSLHKEVLEILEWAKSNNLIKGNITDFVISRMWEAFSKMRNNGFDGNTFKTDRTI